MVTHVMLEENDEIRKCGKSYGSLASVALVVGLKQMTAATDQETPHVKLFTHQVTYSARCDACQPLMRWLGVVKGLTHVP